MTAPLVLPPVPAPIMLPYRRRRCRMDGAKGAADSNAAAVRGPVVAIQVKAAGAAADAEAAAAVEGAIQVKAAAADAEAAAAVEGAIQVKAAGADAEAVAAVEASGPCYRRCRCSWCRR